MSVTSKPVATTASLGSRFTARATSVVAFGGLVWLPTWRSEIEVARAPVSSAAKPWSRSPAVLVRNPSELMENWPLRVKKLPSPPAASPLTMK